MGRQTSEPPGRPAAPAVGILLASKPAAMLPPPRFMRCLLCSGARVLATETDGIYRIACRVCGAVLAYTPHPVDAPELAGRIELLVAPYETDDDDDSDSPV